MSNVVFFFDSGYSLQRGSNVGVDSAVSSSVARKFWADSVSCRPPNRKRIVADVTERVCRLPRTVVHVWRCSACNQSQGASMLMILFH